MSDVDELLHACLDRPEAEWEGALADACARHPEHAGELERRYHALRAIGMTRASTPSSSRFGPYELLGPIGGGAMGTVYLARRDGTDEPVALKLLRDALALSPAARQRFDRERRVLERLEHPSIAAVRDAGEVDGVPYLAMEYVEGESLAHRITQRAGPAHGEEIGAVLRIGRDVARALDAAHATGLVHRDVKPSNVVLRPDGRPVLLDFGLARDADADAHRLTRTDALLGSPAYLAPECVEGRSAGPSADVHALGVTLFEALTGELPYLAATREALFRRILHAPVPSARERNGELDARVDLVLRTAISKREARRYRSASAFADDLDACADGRPISARAPSALQRTRDWIDEHRVAAAFLALLAIGLATTALLLREVSTGLDQTRALALAEAAANAEPELGVLLARRAVDLDRNPATVSRLHEAVARYHPRVVHPEQDSAVVDVAFLSDGGIASLGASGRLLISNASGALVTVADAVRELGRPTSTGILARLDGGWTSVVSAEGGAPTETSYSNELRETLLLSAPDERVEGATVVERARDGLACIVEVDGARAWLARSRSDEAFDATAPLRTFGREASHFLFLPGGRLALLERKTTVRIYARDGALTATVPAHGVYVEALVASPDGRLLATGDGDGVVRLFTVDGAEVGEFFGHEGHVTSLRFEATGERLASGSYDRSVRVFRTRPGEAHFLGGGRAPVVCVDASHGRVLWVDANGLLWIEDAPTDSEREGSNGLVVAQAVRRAVWVEEGEAILAIDASGRTLRYLPVEYADRSAETRRLLFRVPLADGLEDLAHDQERERESVLATTRGGQLVLLQHARGGGDWTSYALSTDLDAQSADVALANGELLVACGTRRGELVLFAVRAGDEPGLEERARVDAHTDWIRSVRFAPDGAALATASRDNTARLWSVARDRIEPRGALLDHRATVVRAVFSPDGRTLATCSTDRTVRLWTGASEPVAVLRGHSGQVWDAAFSGDGRFLWSGSYDRTVRRWPVELDELLAMSRRLVARELDASERARYAELLGD